MRKGWALVGLLVGTGLGASPDSSCEYEVVLNSTKRGFTLGSLTIRYVLSLSLSLSPGSRGDPINSFHSAYERFVFGNPTAWMDVDTDTETPRVAKTGAPDEDFVPMRLALGYDGTASGAMGLGIDQYAHYFEPNGRCSISHDILCSGYHSVCPPGEVCIVDILDGKTDSITVRGRLGPFAYNSIDASFRDNDAKGRWSSLVVNYNDVIDSLYGDHCDNGDLNPYTLGAKTVYANSSAAETRPRIEPKPVPSTDTMAGDGVKVPFYRPDRFSSRMAMDGATDGDCVATYLSTAYNGSNLTMPDLHLYHVIRVGLPNVFVRSDAEPADEIFGSYDTRYFSISAHREYYYHDTSNHSYPIPNVSWWTINARMMNAIVNDDGYAYIVTLPDDDALRLHQEQGLEDWEAPTINWGERQAFVLGLPSNAFIIVRYRDPNPDWIGSPSHVKCYEKPSTNKPILDDSLGVYTPMMSSCGPNVNSLDEFLSTPACGNITARDL